MKLTKDECLIISALIEHGKYDLVRANSYSKERALQLTSAIEDLQKRLDKAGEDKRRQGRTSQNDLSDILKRFIKADKHESI